MSESVKGAGGAGAETNFVVERLIWASKPMGLLFLALWILHPATASHGDYVHLGLVGFLSGAAYGWILYGGRLLAYITLRSAAQAETPNRVPQEYYWGHVVQVMFDNR